jgi:NADH-quinone oxidoreductase subunit K
MITGLLIIAVGLLFLGLSGALVRRSLLVALLSLQLSALAGVVAFVAFGMLRGDPDGLARAVVLLFLAAVQAVLGATVAIVVFRRRATVNLDELRELRG